MRTVIDKNTWDRYELFKHYDECTNPFLIISSEIDITNIYNYAKEHNISMYSAIGYIITKTVNEFDCFKYRVEDGEIIKYDDVISNYTENIDGSTLYFFDVNFSDDINEYNDDFIKTREYAKNNKDNLTYVNNEIWLSCAPWFQFKTITPPYRHDNTIPQFIWDKFKKEDGKVTTDLMVMIHHGFMDGYQLGSFYKRIEENIKNIEGVKIR